MRRDAVFLADIVLSADKVAAYLQGLSREHFGADELRQDAVIRHLSLIGEAASSISEETRAQRPDIPWRLVRGMRNMLIHQYFDVDLDIVYNTATINVPVLAEQAIEFLDILDPELGEKLRGRDTRADHSE